MRRLGQKKWRRPLANKRAQTRTNARKRVQTRTNARRKTNKHAATNSNIQQKISLLTHWRGHHANNAEFLRNNMQMILLPRSLTLQDTSSVTPQNLHFFSRVKAACRRVAGLVVLMTSQSAVSTRGSWLLRQQPSSVRASPGKSGLSLEEHREVPRAQLNTVDAEPLSAIKCLGCPLQ